MSTQEIFFWITALVLCVYLSAFYQNKK